MNKDIDLINLTSHNIQFIKDGKIYLIIKPSIKYRPLRVENVVYCNSIIEGMPVYSKSIKGISYTPPVIDGVYYIVSLATALYCKRKDFLVPITVYDEKGAILGCRGFSTYEDIEECPEI